MYAKKDARLDWCCTMLLRPTKCNLGDAAVGGRLAPSLQGVRGGGASSHEGRCCPLEGRPAPRASPRRVARPRATANGVGGGGARRAGGGPAAPPRAESKETASARSRLLRMRLRIALRALGGVPALELHLVAGFRSRRGAAARSQTWRHHRDRARTSAPSREMTRRSRCTRAPRASAHADARPTP